MKRILITIAGIGLIAVMYAIFVVDRLITAPFPRHQPRFKAWADLMIKPEDRSFLTMWESTIRVLGGVIIVFLIWLFI